jgi:pimeloyl-ACP methyl ester carboxylesterase
MPFCADLYYRCYINKSEGFVFPVILLHGAGGSLLGWPSNLRRIPDQRVFALDLPGHGHSAQAACRTMRSLVRKLHQFIAEMGFYHVVLVFSGRCAGAQLCQHLSRTGCRTFDHQLRRPV